MINENEIDFPHIVIDTNAIDQEAKAEARLFAMTEDEFEAAMAKLYIQKHIR